MEGLSNKGSDAQRSSHKIEVKENVEELEEMKWELAMQRKRVFQEDTGRRSRCGRVKNRLSTLTIDGLVA